MAATNKTNLKLADLAIEEMRNARSLGDDVNVAETAINYRGAMAAVSARDAMAWLRDKLNEAIERVEAAANLRDARLGLSWLRRSSLWDDIQEAIGSIDAYAAAIETLQANTKE